MKADLSLLRVLTGEEREDLTVATHPGFLDLIARSRRECPPGAGIPLEEVVKNFGSKRGRGAVSGHGSRGRR